MNCEIKVVESISKYNKEINEKIMKGTLNKPEKGIVMTPETFSKVFSPERIKLLQKIYRNNIKSIYQLAKDLYDEKERNKLLNNLNDQVSGDRDTYLLAYHFEKTYRLIFGSQINILMGLEQKPVEISETINYYNTTSWKSRNYNFAQYIGFLLSSLLIKVNEKTSQYEITLIGRYFLNYMRSNNLQMQNKLPY